MPDSDMLRVCPLFCIILQVAMVTASLPPHISGRSCLERGCARAWERPLPRAQAGPLGLPAPCHPGLGAGGGRQRISALVVTVLYSDVPRVTASSFLARRVVLWWDKSQAVLPAHPRSPSHEPSLGRGAPAVTVSSAHTSPPTTGSSSTESLCVPGTTLSPCGPASCCG